MRLKAALVASLVLALLVRPTDGGRYVSEEDRQWAQRLKESAEQTCAQREGSQVSDEQRESARSALSGGADGRNLVRDLLLATADEERSLLIEQFARGHAQPFVLAALLLVFWLACCWQYSLRCCRCRARKRIIPLYVKVCALLVVFLMLGGLVINSVLATMAGTALIRSGSQNFLCTVRTAVSVILNGQTSEPTFAGVLAIMKDLEEIETTFDADSDFTSKIDQASEITQEMYLAGIVAEETMSILKSLHAGLVDNPVEQCPICISMDIIRPPVLREIQDSLAVKLGSVNERGSGISQEEKEQITSDINQAYKGLLNFKEKGVRLARNLTDNSTDNMLLDLEHYVELGSVWATVMAFMTITCTGLLIFCGCMTATRLAVQEVKKDKVVSDTNSDAGADKPQEAARNPYSKKVYQWASCTWCCGFCVGIMAFLGYGFMAALATPLSHVCLLVDSIDEGLVDDLASHASAQDIDRLKSIVTGCIQGDHSTALADVWTTSGSVSLRMHLADELDSIAREHYGSLLNNYNKSYSAGDAISSSDEVKHFREVLKFSEGKLKEGLANIQYDCDTFDYNGDKRCDPLMMRYEGSRWVNDCLTGPHSDEMRRVKRSCDRDEYVRYLRYFDNRTENVMARMDMATVMGMSSLKYVLDQAYMEHIVGPANRLSDKTTCDFMAQYYQESLDGLCWQGTLGFSMIVDAHRWAAYFTLILTVVMWGVWRLQKDNHDNYLQLTREEEVAMLKREEMAWQESFDNRSSFITTGTPVKPVDPQFIPAGIRENLTRSSSWD